MAEEKTQDELIRDLVAKHGRSPTVTLLPDPPKEGVFCPIVSVDDHALEPPSLFSDRLPEKHLSEAPYWTSGDIPSWVVDGVQVPLTLPNGAVGRPIEEWGFVAAEFSEMRRGVWDSHARLLDMDLCGVWASLCFGSTVWGFAGTRFSKMSNPQLGYTCLRAYNDWMIEEWCAADPGRYIPCQLPWLSDAQLAASEIERNAARGFRAVSFSENPEGLGFPNIYDTWWDPFFAACQETQTVINLHVGSSGAVRRPCSASHESVSTVLFPVPGIEALADWIYSGVLIRFPGLRIVLSEAGVSWVPMMMERLRRAYRQAGAIGKGWPVGAPTPMELVRRNFAFTSIEDPSAFSRLDLIGEDNVMVETDYPHNDSTWPTSQAMIRSELYGLPAPTIRKVCYENAARLYRWATPPQALLADSEVSREVGS